jgi:CTP synthase
LQELGIQPDVLVLRTEHDITEDMRKKVSLFCNVSPEAVIQCKDAPCIYEVPLRMQKQGLDAVILRKLGIAPEATNSDLTKWNNFLDKKHSAKEEVKIALVGKYVELQDAYKSISESLLQAAVYNNRVLKLVSFQSEKLTQENIAESLKGMDAVLVAPGSGPRGVEGKIIALEYCRNNNIPTLGIVLGMQCMAIEFARNVLGLKDANSTEMDSQTKNNVIDLIESQTVVSSEDGYIRSGAYDCELLADSKAADIYGKTLISERHRNRYEFNNSYKDAFEKAGMRITGVNPETGLAEILEIPSLKWYIGVQFHPQYRSSIEKPHPLFVNFVKAAIEK